MISAAKSENIKVLIGMIEKMKNPDLVHFICDIKAAGIKGHRAAQMAYEAWQNDIDEDEFECR
jgi:hypothetical protein